MFISLFSFDIIDFRAISLIYVRHHWFSSDIIDSRRISLNAVGYHWFSSDIIDSHRIPLILVGYICFSSDIIDSHRISLISIGYHWFSSHITCSFRGTSLVFVGYHGVLINSLYYTNMYRHLYPKPTYVCPTVFQDTQHSRSNRDKWRNIWNETSNSTTRPRCQTYL